MHLSAAIRIARCATSSAVSCGWSIRARAAAMAKREPDPMAAGLGWWVGRLVTLFSYGLVCEYGTGALALRITTRAALPPPLTVHPVRRLQHLAAAADLQAAGAVGDDHGGLWGGGVDGDMWFHTFSSHYARTHSQPNQTPSSTFSRPQAHPQNMSPTCRCRSTLSCRHALASSTAARRSCPGCCSSLASSRSKRVSPSAVLPGGGGGLGRGVTGWGMLRGGGLELLLLLPLLLHTEDEASHQLLTCKAPQRPQRQPPDLAPVVLQHLVSEGQLGWAVEWGRGKLGCARADSGAGSRGRLLWLTSARLPSPECCRCRRKHTHNRPSHNCPTDTTDPPRRTCPSASIATSPSLRTQSTVVPCAAAGEWNAAGACPAAVPAAAAAAAAAAVGPATDGGWSAGSSSVCVGEESGEGRDSRDASAPRRPRAVVVRPATPRSLGNKGA
jgi:hypothetical protein